MSDTDTSVATLTAVEAAERLAVKVETVYAYVSRGLLARRGSGRRSRFDAAEVERLRARGRSPSARQHAPLVVRTALTAIAPDAVHYRGRSALELAGSARLEAVAEWLWGGELAAGRSLEPFGSQPAAVALAHAAQAALPASTLPLERLRVIATVLGTADPMRYETSPAAVPATARALIAGMVDALPRAGAEPRQAWLAARLWSRLTAAAPAPSRLRALDAALVLCADHALSPSTLAARVAASQRADPYAVVQTGMGALSGALHGAASLAAEELLGQVQAGGDPTQVIGARLRRGERIPGFGHALHPDGDPRAPALLALLAQAFARSRALDAAQAVASVMRERGLPAPNIDFALATLSRAASMREGASEAIMAIARVAGWIAHALEEYRAPTPFPQRALYVGAKAGQATGPG